MAVFWLICSFGCLLISFVVEKSSPFFMDFIILSCLFSIGSTLKTSIEGEK